MPLRRRVVLANLRRVFGATVPETEIVRLAQAHYDHLLRLAGEFLSHGRWQRTGETPGLPGGGRCCHSGASACASCKLNCPIGAMLAGFGSLRYLQHLPFRYLKIDGCFIRGLEGSASDRLIVEALVAGFSSAFS